MKTIRDIIGDREAFSVQIGLSVKKVVDYLCEKKVGAVAICDGDQIAGVFSERDLMRRVVNKGLDAASTNVSDVMTKDVFHVSIDESHEVAQALMLGKNFRHLVILDEENKLRGFVSMRELLEQDLADSKDLIRKLNDDYYEFQFRLPKK